MAGIRSFAAGTIDAARLNDGQQWLLWNDQKSFPATGRDVRFRHIRIHNRDSLVSYVSHSSKEAPVETEVRSRMPSFVMGTHWRHQPSLEVQMAENEME